MLPIESAPVFVSTASSAGAPPSGAAAPGVTSPGVAPPISPAIGFPFSSISPQAAIEDNPATIIRHVANFMAISL